MAWVFIVAFLGLSGLGVWALLKRRFPGSTRQVFEWGDKKLRVSDLSVLMIILGLVMALVVWVGFARDPTAGLVEPEAVAVQVPTPNPPPVAANPPVPTGPWRAESNGVVLTVATVDYEDDHLAQVRFRIDNNSTAVVEAYAGWFSVVDNLGRARNADTEQSSIQAEMSLAPGENTFARAKVALPWATESTHFDTRINITFKDSGQYFTIATPSIAIPTEQRVE